MGKDWNDDGTIDYYTAVVNSATAYYPFGMVMFGRSYSAARSYRFGFNGKEKVDEVEGLGNCLDLGARLYSSRLGKLFSTDIKEAHYPWQSTYAYYGNSPLYQLDINGEGGPGGIPAYANPGGNSSALDNTFVSRVIPSNVGVLDATNNHQIQENNFSKYSPFTKPSLVIHAQQTTITTTESQIRTVSPSNPKYSLTWGPDPNAGKGGGKAFTLKNTGSFLSKSGTTMTVAGAILTCTVVFAEVGVPLMAAGEYTSYAGAAATAIDDISKGHTTRAIVDASSTLLIRQGGIAANNSIKDVTDVVTKNVFKASVNTGSEVGSMMRDGVEAKVAERNKK